MDVDYSPSALSRGMSEDRIEAGLRPAFNKVVLDVREAMKKGDGGKWTALEGPVPSYISITPKSNWNEGALQTVWVVEAQTTPTSSNWGTGEYRLKKESTSYPTEQDMYNFFMFFRNQGPWCAANALYDVLKALFNTGIGHDAVRDFVDGETVRSVMAD